MTLQHDLLNRNYFKEEYFCAAGPRNVLGVPLSSCTRGWTGSTLSTEPNARPLESNTQSFPWSCLKGELLPPYPGLRATATSHKLLTVFLGTVELQEVTLQKEDQNLDSEGKCLDLVSFGGYLPCVWEAVKGFFSLLWEGVWFLLCVSPSHLLFATSLRKRRDAQISLLRDGI